ncbi:hypothetical protein [Stieleria varia]|uniref:Uncharacterized protein n=1 Tax=Stieleria varia TaxID=2528005 RepID=A0A5C5ZIP1_9BACT|nr:hypothetical protein [Stieleria varia]TWT87013.1 hypothetical protein Pla52n_70380 [Stieleria varia]TWT87048.1 hypothetical protein Pla52n_70210 [Stieleria varia]
MRQRTKTLLWIALPTLIVACLGWTAINLQRGIKSAYYEWGVTCIIASYAEDHDGSPPAKWDDLVGYEYHTKYLPDPRTMDAAAQHISVDFESLVAFANEDIPDLPADVITPIQGIEQHWIHPKTTLERYFRDGERPHGSFDGEYAKQLRYYAEGGD